MIDRELEEEFAECLDDVMDAIDTARSVYHGDELPTLGQIYRLGSDDRLTLSGPTRDVDFWFRGYACGIAHIHGISARPTIEVMEINSVCVARFEWEGSRWTYRPAINLVEQSYREPVELLWRALNGVDISKYGPYRLRWEQA